ncbi:tetratricopeptide repeat protein [Lysobacter sp. LF1]|uniref:Tetratricopeptide repeat protein n=1 Tax=Lysobacter stagni TaxID=3045172 RepID=A0ABT6XIF5_9GAMM|nr:tetratricopeptide repeat protein [Lysobacter sp. LF1]MDI9239836.1 tetratricopeptide repeat protein [Lysobacter sp. LF1]
MRTFPCLAFLFIVCAASAQDATFNGARSLVDQHQYAQALEVLAPMEAAHSGDAQFHYLIGRAALGAGDAEKARAALARSLELNPDSPDAHLALGRAYYALDQYALARDQFEIALRFDGLPPDLLSQVQIYDEAARQSLEEGRSTTAFGYAELGVGVYRVNSTRSTAIFGDGGSDAFYNLRASGGFNHSFENGYAIDGTLDYRHRIYDDSDTRDDRDLRWSIAGSNSFGDNNLALGLRGRVSYRGNGDYRNDVSGFTSYTRNLNTDNQLTLGLDVRRRRYPEGPLRDRSRTTATASVGWSTSLAGGAGSFSLTAHGGRNYATSRPDGESNVFGATASFDYTFNDSLDGFLFVWWERDSFNTDAVHFHPDALDQAVVLRREDNLYEGGAGLIWTFAPKWSLRPELLYIRDQSNSVTFNYSSTEAWINVRRAF